MSDQERQPVEADDDTRGALGQRSPKVSRQDRRINLGKILHEVIGEDGVASLKERNWTATGASLVALGVASDLLQVFGEISQLGLIISGIAAAVLGVIVVFRPKGRKVCVAPFVSALLLGALFTVILITQNLADAADAGIFAKKYPDFHEALFKRFASVEAKQDRIETKLDHVIAEFERANPNADPTTIEAFRSAVESLAASGDARKRKALAEFADGEEERAITDLTRLAEDQTEAAQDNAEQAAQTWKEVGALAFHVDTEKALRAYRTAVELSPDDPTAGNQLGSLLYRIGDLDGATALYESILSGSDLTDRMWKAVALNNLGLIESKRGNLDAAAKYHRRSLALDEELGLKKGIAASLNNLGLIEQTRGNLDAAAEYLRRSLALDEELDRKEGIARALNNLGLIEHSRGNLDAAAEFFRRGLGLYEEMGRKEGIAQGLNNLGLIDGVRGNLDAASEYFQRSLGLMEELGRKEGIAQGLNNLGLIEFARGNLDAATEFFSRSLALDEELGRKEGIAQGLNNLGLIEQSRGNLDAAAEYHGRSLALDEELGRKEGIAASLDNLGQIEQIRGNLDAACSRWKRSAEILASIGAERNRVKVQNMIDDTCAEGL